VLVPIVSMIALSVILAGSALQLVRMQKNRALVETLLSSAKPSPSERVTVTIHFESAVARETEHVIETVTAEAAILRSTEVARSNTLNTQTPWFSQVDTSEKRLLTEAEPLAA
jgi:hypothetical protein